MNMRIKINLDLNVNRVIKAFIVVDLFLFAGWGLIEPAFSVFIVEQVAGANLVTVGVAAAIYWTLKSFIQMPVARYLDRHPGEKDDFYALIIGLLIIGFSAFGFGLVREIWQLYFMQVVRAVGFGLYAATWPAIFSRHLDSGRVSFDWALDSTAVGIAAGVSGFLGGVMANYFGFVSVFVAGGVLALCAACVLLWVPDLILPKPTGSRVHGKDHTLSKLGR